jgi:hypothetical protein
VTPYLVPPTIPEGQTVAEYKRARPVKKVKRPWFPRRNK